MNDPVFYFLLPLFASFWIMGMAWGFGMRPFLKEKGVEVTPLSEWMRPGTEMISDAILVLEYCRGRCPLPVSFWIYLASMGMAGVTFVGVMIVFLIWY